MRSEPLLFAPDKRLAVHRDLLRIDHGHRDAVAPRVLFGLVVVPELVAGQLQRGDLVPVGMAVDAALAEKYQEFAKLVTSK